MKFVKKFFDIKRLITNNLFLYIHECTDLGIHTVITTIATIITLHPINRSLFNRLLSFIRSWL